VLLDPETEPFRGDLLTPFELVVAELEDAAAGLADHVVVVLVPEHVFEAPAAVAGLENHDEARLFQHPERAVDGGARDLRIELSAAFEQRLGGELVVGRQRLPDDKG
jgi:hypothetical protein